jgi:hypothetical protein
MDTNGDGKISYPEFEYWWKFGKKGKMRKIVGLKFKALKLINKAIEKLTQANVNLKVYMFTCRNNTPTNIAVMNSISP